MSKICSYNYSTGEQKVYAENYYLIDAIENIENIAINYVLEKEGIKYLKKIFHKKSRLPNGYSLVKKHRLDMCKITVFYKEPNGYLTYGVSKKVISFFSFKIPQVHPKREQSEMDSYYVECFDKCIAGIEQRTKIEPITKSEMSALELSNLSFVC